MAILQADTTQSRFLASFAPRISVVFDSVFDIDDNAATANAEAKSMLGPEDAGAIRRQEGVSHMCLVQ
jgi:hypothetical protein